jgi:dUTP pyrophosphatase
MGFRVNAAYFTRIHPDAKLPTWATPESVCCDLYTIEKVVIFPGELVVIRTGLVARPPMGYHFEVRARSSICRKSKGLVIPHGLGTIDADYCGPEDELTVPLYHTAAMATSDPAIYEKGERFAQLKLVTNIRFSIEEAPLRKTESRGGFGSTGTK